MARHLRIWAGEAQATLLQLKKQRAENRGDCLAPEERLLCLAPAGTVSSQTARLTLQITEQEVRLVQLGGERELTVSKTINARAGLFASAFSVLSVTRTSWGVREVGEHASDTPLPLTALSPAAVRFNFLRPLNPGNLPRSRSLTMFKRRIYRDFDGREKKRFWSGGTFLSGLLNTWPLFWHPQWQQGGSDPNEEEEGVCGHVTLFRNCPPSFCPSLLPSLSSFPLSLQRGQEGRVATEWKAPWSAEEA